MSELITVYKKDPEFRKYLEGSFSKEKCALPINSLNVNTEAEQVTFKIVNQSSLEKPYWVFHWFSLFKVRNLIWVALPLFLIFTKIFTSNMPSEISYLGLSINWTLFLTTIGAVSCIYISLSLRNDYSDHIRGLDRIHPKSGSQAIQQGWIKAYQVKRWSYIFLVCGIILGFPSVFTYPHLLGITGGISLFLVLLLSSAKMGFKYSRLTEIALFILLGPLLTFGFQISMGGDWDLEVIFIGILTGWLAVTVFYIKNFEQILINSMVGFDNTITWLGFEKSKRFLVIWWVLFCCLLSYYHFEYTATIWVFVFFLFSLMSSYFVSKLLTQLKSPAGSEIKSMTRIFYQWTLSVAFLWVIENIWYIVVTRLEQ